MPSIEELLEKLDLTQYTRLFLENEVDLRTLQILTEKDLEELGLPFGPRKRLLSALAELKPRQSTATRLETSEYAAGERRQLTVMFCDMVGFTELAGRIDPELLQAIIKSYEDACAECIARYEGHLFQRLGDGIVAFFGYPVAHEADADRAIRSGLAIIEELARLEVPEAGHLRVRIGIANGLVVSSADGRVVGETMNLAARLQAIAQPGTIVVSDTVRRLAPGAFDYFDLGKQSLKGISRPEAAHQALGPSAAASRFEAATKERLTPLVGREQELGLLIDRWRLARGDEGQVVLLWGEPGIGKSRIVSTLRERLEEHGARPLHLQCSPYHANSAFYPFIDWFERELKIGRDESPGSKLDKLEALVVTQLGRPLDDVRFIAGILSIAATDRYGPLALSPQRRKDQTIRALVDFIEAIARTQPGMLLVEDVHWADPTTLDVLARLIDRIRSMPLLAVITSRPEFQSPWPERPYLATINLGRLTRDQSSALVSRVTGGKPLPADLLEQIIAKTDGVPLFVEELTKTILESGNLRDEGAAWAYAGGTDVAIPATLRDSLMARLDRVQPVKEIAQIGAAIGREFSYELIAAVAPMAAAALDETLARLTESGLAFRREAGSSVVFTFKHALVQDVAYESLLKTTRQQLHGRIAQVLQERFPGTGDTEPELLAQHYTAAGQDETAIPFWRRAGEVALQRFALREANVHLRKGLTLVETLPQGVQRDRSEMELRTLLGPTVVAQRGWAQAEVSSILEPAWALAESLGQRQSYLPILHGLWVHYLCLDRLALSLEWAGKMLAIGKTQNDDSLEIVGHRAAAASYFWLGDFVAARRHGDIIHAMYDPQRHFQIAALTNTDPLTGDRIYRTQYLWMLGYPEQALAVCDAKDEHARRRNHPFDLAFALTLGSQLFDFLAEPEQLLRRTEEAERVGREHGVPLLSEVMAEISKGIAWLRAGRVAESAGQIRDAATRLSATGHRIWIAYLRALQAEALALTGDLPGALTLIDESVQRTETGEERSHYAEVLRLKGWLLARAGRPDEAEPCLCAAIDVARGQQAKSWELRAAMTLARLRAERGDRRSARELLAPVYDWFTEGFGTKDLKEARALLDQLQS